MRRLSLMFVLVAVLAGCSSESGDQAGDTGSDATKFCAAIKTLEAAKGSADVAAAGAAFSSSAADLRAYAPAEIKDATGTYAEMIDNIGKAAKSGTMEQLDLQKQLAAGMASKAEDIAKVAIWVSKNCPR